jgi:putative endonuclease
MYYVYLLRSVDKRFLYVGSTDNLKRRFEEHNSGTQKATKAYVPLKLIYYEAYASKHDALLRENALKHHGGTIAALKRRLKLSEYLMSRGLGGRRG